MLAIVAWLEPGAHRVNANGFGIGDSVDDCRCPAEPVAPNVFFELFGNRRVVHGFDPLLPFKTLGAPAQEPFKVGITQFDLVHLRPR